MRCGVGTELFTSSVMWAVWIEKEYLITRVQFWPLVVYHIFHNTDTYSPFCLCKRGGIESKALKKQFWKEVGKEFMEKIFRKKHVDKKSLGKKI